MQRKLLFFFLMFIFIFSMNFCVFADEYESTLVQQYELTDNPVYPRCYITYMSSSISNRAFIKLIDENCFFTLSDNTFIDNWYPNNSDVYEIKSYWAPSAISTLNKFARDDFSCGFDVYFGSGFLFDPYGSLKSNETFNVSYMEFSSISELKADMEQYSSYDSWYNHYKDDRTNKQPDEISDNNSTGDGMGGSSINGKLPSLTLSYSIKDVFRVGVPAQTWNGYFTWDYTQHSIYMLDPNNYSYEVRYNWFDFDKDFNKLYTMQFTSYTHPLDCNIVSQNYSSWNFYNLYKLINSNYPQEGVLSSLTPHPNGFLYFRTFDRQGNSSYWQVYYVAAITNSPTFTYLGEYDGTGSKVDDTFIPDNIPDYLPPSGVDPDDTTTSSTYKDGDLYNPSATSNVNSSNVITILKSTVSSVTEISSLISLVMSWFPTWLISLISASIGAVLVVGLLKIIIK